MCFAEWLCSIVSNGLNKMKRRLRLGRGTWNGLSSHGSCFPGPSAQALGKAVTAAFVFPFSPFRLSFPKKKNTEK